MLAIALVLTLAGAAADTDTGLLPEPAGIVQGIVVDSTNEDEPLAGVKVILRAGAGGELIPVAETETDRYGRFVFDHVPADPAIVYLPGANRETVHYPGPRVRLNAKNRIAHVKIATFDAVATPNPLVAKRHDFDVTVEGEVLKVTESLLLSNPTRTTYVGQPTGMGQPVTFWLSIPKDFDRVTFHREYFGRRFLVIDHRPVTDIPWLPGERELRFTYHVPLAESEGRFHRPLDVPTSDVRVRVRGADAGQVSCNLPRAQAADGELLFASAGEGLPIPFTLAIEFGALPFPWMQYARWGALVVIIALVAATVAAYHIRGSRSSNAGPGARQRPSTRQRAA